MSPVRRRFRLPTGSTSGVALATLALLACESALLVDPAEDARAIVSVTYSVAPEATAADGPRRAFASADSVRIRLTRRGGGGAVVADATLPLEALPDGRRVRLEVLVKAPEESFHASLELLAGHAPLFHGSAGFSIGPGQSAAVEVGLLPLVAGVRVPESMPTIRALNDTIALEGAAVFATGDTIPDVPLVWSSLDPAVAGTLPGGLLVSRPEGEARIVGSLHAFSGTFTVRVRADVGEVTITPGDVTIEVRRRARLSAAVSDPKNNVLPDRPVIWGTSDPTIATVDPEGEVVGVRRGTAIIHASSEGKADSVLVRVEPLPVVEVGISPGSLSLRPGQSAQLTVTALDTDGEPVPDAEVLWSSSAPGVASVSQGGRVTAVGGGAASIRAAAGEPPTRSS